MSLDVYLEIDEPAENCCCGKCMRTVIAYTGNITHNLGSMAVAAGIYKHLWRPEELGIEVARELIEPLRSGRTWLTANVDEARKYDSPNGWGIYEHFVRFVDEYLRACDIYPDARVSVSR